MMMGIDVSKDKLDIHLLGEDRHFEIKNTRVAIRFFKNQLHQTHSIKLIVFEATGGYEKLLQVYLIEQDLPYHRAHPNRVHAFARNHVHGCFGRYSLQP